MISSGGESVELTRYKEEICQTPWLTLASNTVCSIAHPAGLCVVRSACGVTARYPGCSECSSAALKSRDRHRQVDSRSRKGKINSSLSWNCRHWTSPSLLFEMSGCQAIVYLQLHLSHTVLGWRKEAAIFCWRMKESKSCFCHHWNAGIVGLEIVQKKWKSVEWHAIPILWKGPLCHKLGFVFFLERTPLRELPRSCIYKQF